MDRKRFFLFNTFRWNNENPNKPECCDVVPILFEGQLAINTIDNVLGDLVARDLETGATPEGIVVYYHAFRAYTKHTFKNPYGKWNETK